MPITIIADAGNANANSYGTLAAANVYFAERPFSDVWEGELDNERKAKVLLAATRRIDQVGFEGYRANTMQRLAFPRSGIEREDGSEFSSSSIPRNVVEATFELALSYLTAAADPVTPDALGAFTALSVAGISLTLRDSRADDGDALPGVVMRLLAEFIGSAGIRMERA